MPIKVSQLTELTTITGTVDIPVIDNSGSPISKKATAANIASYVLTGNAATATKLATARNINGVAFDGTQDITITTSLAAATDTTIGGVIIGGGISVEPDGTISVDVIPVATTTVAGTVIVGDGLSVGVDGTISVDVIPVATTTVAGTVIVGDGLSVGVDGTISTPTRKFHGFSVDANSNLIYSTTTDTTISLQDQYGADLYEDTDIGTNDYNYSLDTDGNLIVTFS
jgi:hypothetical protein